MREEIEWEKKWFFFLKFNLQWKLDFILAKNDGMSNILCEMLYEFNMRSI